MDNLGEIQIIHFIPFYFVLWLTCQFRLMSNFIKYIEEIHILFALGHKTNFWNFSFSQHGWIWRESREIYGKILQKAIFDEGERKKKNEFPQGEHKYTYSKGLW